MPQKPLTPTRANTYTPLPLTLGPTNSLYRQPPVPRIQDPADNPTSYILNRVVNDRPSPPPQPLSQQMFGQDTGSLADIGSYILHKAGVPSPSPSDYQTVRDSQGMYRTVPSDEGLQKKYMGLFAPTAPEGFYSKAGQVLDETKQLTFEGQQLLNYMKAKGVKDEELKWSGLLDLAAQPKVTRAQAMDVVDRAPGIGETVLGGKDFEEFNKLTNERNELEDLLAQRYRNVTNPATGRTFQQDYYYVPHEDSARRFFPQDPELTRYHQLTGLVEDAYQRAERTKPKWTQYTLPGRAENHREILLTRKDAADMGMSQFIGTHYEETPNLISHIRVNNRYALNGEKTFNIDEGQSDWSNTLNKEWDAYRENHGFDTKEKWATAPKNEKDALWDKFNAQPDQARVAEVRARVADLERQYNAARLAYRRHSQEEPELSGEYDTWYQQHNALGRKLNEVSDAMYDARNELNGALNPERNTPRGPYIEGGTWQDLNVRRGLLEAARDPQVKWFTWTTGDQQAERYHELADKITWEFNHRQGLYSYKPFLKGMPQPRYYSTDNLSADTLEKQVVAAKQIIAEAAKGPSKTKVTGLVWQERTPNGYRVFAETEDGTTPVWNLVSDRTTADRIVKETRDKGEFVKPDAKVSGELNGDSLLVAGQGKRHAYDVNFRKLVEQNSKQKAIKLKIGSNTPEGQEVWAIPMTDELRARLLRPPQKGGGFPMYSLLPPAAFSTYKQRQQDKSSPK